MKYVRDLSHSRFRVFVIFLTIIIVVGVISIKVFLKDRVVSSGETDTGDSATTHFEESVEPQADPQNRRPGGTTGRSTDHKQNADVVVTESENAIDGDGAVTDPKQQKTIHEQYGLPHPETMRGLWYGRYVNGSTFIHIDRGADPRDIALVFTKFPDAELIRGDASQIDANLATVISGNKATKEVHIHNAARLSPESAGILANSTAESLTLMTPALNGEVSEVAARSLFAQSHFRSVTLGRGFPLSDEILLAISEIEGIETLRIYNFDSDERRGLVSETGIRAIGKLRNLRELTLHISTVSEPEGPGTVLGEVLRELPKLKVLRLSGWQLGDDGFRHCVPHLSGLIALSIEGSGVSDDAFVTVSEIRGLEYLVCPNGISDISADAISSLGSLRSLDISLSSITDLGLRELSERLTSLRHLGMMDCRHVSAKGLISLLENRQLSTLALSGFRGDSPSALRALSGANVPATLCISDWKGLSSELLVELLAGTKIKKLHLFWSSWLAEESKPRLVKSLSPIQLEFDSPITEIPFDVSY